MGRTEQGSQARVTASAAGCRNRRHHPPDLPSCEAAVPEQSACLARRSPDSSLSPERQDTPRSRAFCGRPLAHGGRHWPPRGAGAVSTGAPPAPTLPASMGLGGLRLERARCSAQGRGLKRPPPPTPSFPAGPGAQGAGQEKAHPHPKLSQGEGGQLLVPVLDVTGSATRCDGTSCLHGTRGLGEAAPCASFTPSTKTPRRPLRGGGAPLGLGNFKCSAQGPSPPLRPWASRSISPSGS